MTELGLHYNFRSLQINVYFLTTEVVTDLGYVKTQETVSTAVHAFQGKVLSISRENLFVVVSIIVCDSESSRNGVNRGSCYPGQAGFVNIVGEPLR